MNINIRISLLLVIASLASASLSDVINSLQICLITKCGYEQFSSSYPTELLQCLANESQCSDYLGGLFNMCQTNNCISTCNSSFSQEMQKCNNECINNNQKEIQNSCDSQNLEMDKPNRKIPAQTHKGVDLSSSEDSGSESLWIALYCLIGLVIGVVIIFIFCYYIKKRQQADKKKTGIEIQQTQQLPPSQINTRSPSIQQPGQPYLQEIVLGYPTPNLPFENNYFAAEYKLTGNSQTQINQGLQKQNSIPLPDHMQKYLPFQIPIQNVVIGENCIIKNEKSQELVHEKCNNVHNNYDTQTEKQDIESQKPDFDEQIIKFDGDEEEED